MDPNEEWERWRTWLGDDPKGDMIYAQVVEMLMSPQIWGWEHARRELFDPPSPQSRVLGLGSRHVLDPGVRARS